MSADTAVATEVLTDPFAASHDIFETLVGWLGHTEAATLSAAELEQRLQVQSREVFRQLFADYLELRAHDEPRLSPVVDAQAMAHGAVEVGHTRPLTTVFGEVEVRRIAYRKRGAPNLYPHRRRAQPATGEAVARAAQTGRGGKFPRQLRRGGAGHRASDRPEGG